MGQKSVKTVSVPCFILLRPYITVPFRFFPGRIPFSIRCTVRIDRPWTACCRPAGNTCLWFLPKVFRNPCVPFGWLFVGSANNAFPLYSGRFSLTCPRTVLTRLHVYGSPSVTSSYLTHLWIFALHSAHTTKVFLYI